MKAILTLAVACAVVAGSGSPVAASPITLDFTSGSFVNGPGGLPQSYSQNGFTLQVVTPGNHMDLGLIGVVGFHNGPTNVNNDNDLVLTFAGGAFDFAGLDLAGFGLGATSLVLTASNGATAMLTGTGFQPTPGFTNVTSVRFSTPFTGGNNEQVGLNSILLNNTPTLVVAPEPATLAVFGLMAVTGVAYRRRNREAVTGPGSTSSAC